MRLFNVVRSDGTALNKYPLNELQANTMVRIWRTNYGFMPTINEIL